MLGGAVSLPAPISRGVPSGAVDDEHGVGARRYLGRDFIEMPLHGLGVAAWKDKAGADTALGTDGAKDIGRFRALVLGRRGPAATPRPAPREFGFLTDPGLALPPNFNGGIGRELGSDRFQRGAEVFF